MQKQGNEEVFLVYLFRTRLRNRLSNAQESCGRNRQQPKVLSQTEYCHGIESHVGVVVPSLLFWRPSPLALGLHLLHLRLAKVLPVRERLRQLLVQRLREEEGEEAAKDGQGAVDEEREGPEEEWNECFPIRNAETSEKPQQPQQNQLQKQQLF